MSTQPIGLALSSASLQLAVSYLLLRLPNDPALVDDLLVLMRNVGALAGKTAAVSYEEEGALRRAIARIVVEMQELQRDLPKVSEVLAARVIELQKPPVPHPNHKGRPRRSVTPPPTDAGADTGSHH